MCRYYTSTKILLITITSGFVLLEKHHARIIFHIMRMSNCEENAIDFNSNYILYIILHLIIGCDVKHVDALVLSYSGRVSCGRTFAALEQTSNNELLITLIIAQVFSIRRPAPFVAVRNCSELFRPSIVHCFESEKVQIAFRNSRNVVITRFENVLHGSSMYFKDLTWRHLAFDVFLNRTFSMSPPEPS